MLRVLNSGGRTTVFMEPTMLIVMWQRRLWTVLIAINGRPIIREIRLTAQLVAAQRLSRLTGVQANDLLPVHRNISAFRLVERNLLL